MDSLDTALGFAFADYSIRLQQEVSSKKQRRREMAQDCLWVVVKTRSQSEGGSHWKAALLPEDKIHAYAADFDEVAVVQAHGSLDR
jgi:hypothetical protein